MARAPGAFVIAEVGVNHNGSLDLALQSVSAAKACGADAVKFQTFTADRLVTQAAAKAGYQQAATPGDDTQHAMLRSLELDLDDFRRIRDHCHATGIEFLSSPFDELAADMLVELGVRLIKIPSGEITNLPFLRHVGSLGKGIILSTGMSWLSEVETAVRTLQDVGADELTLLHCVSEYPAPADQVNLRAMQTMAMAFGLPVGYSDHTLGIEIPLAAVALGARVIEKHFTLDT
jgi:N,N'-diacetyllegionaminate synthase